MSDVKEYSKLNKYESYDHDAAAEMAEAIMEIKTLTNRVAYLKDLVEENQELTPFLWTTAEGVTKALHDIDDDHLKNIMKHLVETNRVISKAIQAEARGRNMTIPTIFSSDAAMAFIESIGSATKEILDSEE